MNRKLLPLHTRLLATSSPRPSLDAEAGKAQAPSQTQNPVLDSDAQHALLRSPNHQRSTTCTLCRRRKVKCDRATPCGGCLRAGLECVPSIPSRAPRGRQGGRKARRADRELLERMAKLEGLVKSIEEREVALGHDQRSGCDGRHNGWTAEIDHNERPVERLDSYLGKSFWVTLSEEINGLKDVLEASSSDEGEGEGEQPLRADISPSSLPHQRKSGHGESFIFRTVPVESSASPTHHQIYTFCEIYLANVDPVLKILHAPSLRKYLQEGAAELACSPGQGGLEALRFVIYYAATLSMAEGECRHRIGEDKAVLSARYRAATELALAKADVVNTVDISTLQALAIYVISVRVNDNSRLMWTLVSLAVRIAQAMGLHLESTLSPLRPFEREMRRRLWWHICALDSHAAEDRASNPIIAADSFNTQLPLQIDDEDLCFDSSEDLEGKEGFTDMTFCLISYEIFDTVRQLNYVPARELGQPQNGFQEERWSRRIDTVVKLQRRIEERYLRHLDLADPFHWTTRMVADVITATLWLLIYRPLQKRPDTAPPRIADPGIFLLSIEVLERAYQLKIDPAASPFRWLSQTHVPWYAVAVTTAELCVKMEGPLVERAWAVIEHVFKEAAKHVADSDKGMLWRPIKKLMNRAQRERQKHLDSNSVLVESSVMMTGLNGSDQDNCVPNTADANFDRNNYERQAEDSVASLTQGLQQTSYVSSAGPFNWDPWLAAATTTESQSSSDMNEVAWTNWEDFMDDFQGQDDTMVGASDHLPGF